MITEEKANTTQLDHELNKLQTMADRIHVKLHLGKAELRDTFRVAGKKLDIVRGEVKRLSEEAAEPTAELGEDLKALLAQVDKTFKRLADRL